MANQLFGQKLKATLGGQQRYFYSYFEIVRKDELPLSLGNNSQLRTNSVPVLFYGTHDL